MNDAILISCGKCGGKMRWLVLDAVTRADARDWMWEAATRGDLIHTGRAAYDEQSRPVCKCATGTGTDE